jgi:hypothetical protein
LLRSVLAVLVVAQFTILPHERLNAQENRTTRTLTVGATWVAFEDYGGSIAAALAQFSIDRGYSQVLGWELSTFALVPLGGASAIPECPPGVPCQTRSTPSLLFGGFGSLIARGGEDGLRAVLGIGPVWSTGGEGLANSSSFAGIVGIDWVAPGKSKRALTLSARLVFLDSPIAGARLLFLPGLGLSF